jgi:hypothetical protein
MWAIDGRNRYTRHPNTEVTAIRDLIFKHLNVENHLLLWSPVQWELTEEERVEGQRAAQRALLWTMDALHPERRFPGLETKGCTSSGELGLGTGE